MGKNLYERRKARAAKPTPPAKYRELELLVIKRAAMFCEEYMATDGWSRMCERKAMLLNAAVEHLLARKPDVGCRMCGFTRDQHPNASHTTFIDPEQHAEDCGCTKCLHAVLVSPERRYAAHVEMERQAHEKDPE